MYLEILLAGVIAIFANVQATDDMGPAAFLWPPDRTWSAAKDNTPPCGSAAGVGNRTSFPLTRGAVALVLQDESYSINLAISYSNDPQSNDDFTTIVPAKDFPELYPGHECYSVPNPPSNITSGSNATLQIQYVSEFDTTQNETFYACADITYVALSDFTTNIPCFNVSTEDPEIVSSQIAGEPTSSATSTSAAATGEVTTTSAAAHRSNKGLSGGDIAGIVVGTVVGGSLILGALFFLWCRHRKRARREEKIAIRMKELTNPVQKTASETSNI